MRINQGNRVKERTLNPIEQFVARSGVSDSHGAKLWSTAQSLGFMPCVPSTTDGGADGSVYIHPIALEDQLSLISDVAFWGYDELRTAAAVLAACRTGD
jgi:hypothetical protein